MGLLLAHPALRTRLLENASLLKRRLAALGLPIDPSPTPVVWLVIGDAANMQRIQQSVWNRRIPIDYIPQYTGTGPHGGLRIAVFSQHTPGMNQQLIHELSRVL